jgi:hypothetical protein
MHVPFGYPEWLLSEQGVFSVDVYGALVVDFNWQLMFEYANRPSKVAIALVARLRVVFSVQIVTVQDKRRLPSWQLLHG